MNWQIPGVVKRVRDLVEQSSSVADAVYRLSQAFPDEVITPDGLSNAWRRYRARSPGLPPMASIFKHNACPIDCDLDEDCTSHDNAAGAARARIEAERAERAASDFESLRPEDDVSVGNDGRIDREAARQKRQEYSRTMGDFAAALHAGGDPATMPPHLGSYVGLLAEQERRFGNRRLARSVSLAAAHEQLHLRLVTEAAKVHFSDRIVPTGYAARRATVDPRRTLVLFLSDLHLGAEMSPLDNPTPFRQVEERRRLEHIVRSAFDYKPAKRGETELMIVLNGDLIEGDLGHDRRDGAPLVEQKLRFWHYFRIILAHAAQLFPRVRVVGRPGNHGRDVFRHPGRATSSKWDGHEWEMLYALSCMCSSLPNVVFELPYKAAALTALYDFRALVTHADTEIKLGHPLMKHESNLAQVTRLSLERVYGLCGAANGEEFQLVMGGHYHTAIHLPGPIEFLWNGMLVPHNGYARASGHNGPCGQWLFEATPRHLVGDARYIGVGPVQDKDESLGSLITPLILG